ncbi:MAG: hypothetical protein KJN75_00910 [Muriicola sp.]|nr:hypothetical protein [Muriicola sp.]
MAIIAIVSASNCSRIPENNDPIIGIWAKVEIVSTSESARQTNREEWIFNDVYLGRYHNYSGTALSVQTDFSWKKTDGVYTISYPGTDMPSHEVRMKEADNVETLEDVQGNILAHRE